MKLHEIPWNFVKIGIYIVFEDFASRVTPRLFAEQVGALAVPVNELLSASVTWTSDWAQGSHVQFMSVALDKEPIQWNYSFSNKWLNWLNYGLW